MALVKLRQPIQNDEVNSALMCKEIVSKYGYGALTEIDARMLDIWMMADRIGAV